MMFTWEFFHYYLGSCGYLQANIALAGQIKMSFEFILDVFHIKCSDSISLFYFNFIFQLQSHKLSIHLSQLVYLLIKKELNNYFI